ncbi:MAG: hypothetical protein IT170_12815, partial [Bryobacterales bacterium]|nr:hypothetical protein [Bryobacterales bacterium]
LPANAAPLVPWESEEDQQPGEHPHAEPAPHPHSTNREESIPNPRPGGPVIVNATVSRTTTPAPSESASAPQPNTIPQSKIAPASAERIPSDSLFPTYGSNPENPDKTPHPESAANIMENQQDSPTQPTSSRPVEFSINPEIPHPVPSSGTAPAATAPSPASTKAPSPAITLSQTWLSADFLHQHESPKAFETLLNYHIRAYQPATPAEELLVFRITQKSWLLSRLETWERVIADSQVAHVRQKHPNTAAPAAIALSLLEAKETAQTRFQDRIASLRQEHEAALDHLTAKLEAQQLRREAAHLRAQRKNPPCPTSRSYLSFGHTPATAAACDTGQTARIQT